jgi:cell division protein FtsA
MKKMMFNKNIVAIDIGTTKICVLVADVDASGRVEILGIGQHPSYGLKKGVVVNISATVDSIKRAITHAEAMSGIAIESAIVGISGGHIQSLNSTGVVAIKQKDVTQGDVDRVIEAAKAVPLKDDREILHVLPQFFRVDGNEHVQDSLSMHGIRLEAQVHIITGAVSSAQNIIKACEMAGVRVTDIILEQIASAGAVLTPTEKELGAGILDIGGGTSDFAIYKEGRIRHSKVIPIAGNHFTNDLAIGLSVPLKRAEEIKRKYGFVSEELYLDQEKDFVEVPLEFEGKSKLIDTYSIYEVLQPRAQELFELLRDEVDMLRLRSFMPSGLVLTGGGSLLSGMQKLAQDCFGMPVRIGYPCNTTIEGVKNSIPDLLKSPIYSTGYGLLIHVMKKHDRSLLAGEYDAMVSKIFKRMKSWIYDFL